jgi:hypothetical protein
MQRFPWRRGRAAPAGAPSGGAGARAAGRPPRRWPQTPAHHSPAVVLRGAARGRWQSSQSSTTRREGIACSGQAAYAHCPLPSQRSTRPDLSGLHCLPGVLSNAIDPSELSDRGGTERMHFGMHCPQCRMIMTLTIGLLSFCYDIIANRDRGTALRRPGPVAAPVTGSVHGRLFVRSHG